MMTIMCHDKGFNGFQMHFILTFPFDPYNDKIRAGIISPILWTEILRIKTVHILGSIWECAQGIKDKSEKSTFPGISYEKNYETLGSHWNFLASVS